LLTCKHEETKINTIIDDAGDVEQTVCANKECGFIIKEEVLVTRPDGTEHRRPRRVDSGKQPEGFQFAGRGGRLESPEEKIMSAQEMLALAVKTREETVGKQARELAKQIITACAENVLAGEHRYQVEAESNTPGEIISLAVKELKTQGYRVKKEPVPGEGVWITIKWPTQTRKKRKEKGKKLTAEETLEFGPQEKTKKRKPPSKRDLEVRQRQRQAAKRREEAMKARSD
jgi:hypothetical protein